MGPNKAGSFSSGCSWFRESAGLFSDAGRGAAEGGLSVVSEGGLVGEAAGFDSVSGGVDAAGDGRLAGGSAGLVLAAGTGGVVVVLSVVSAGCSVGIADGGVPGSSQGVVAPAGVFSGN